MISSAKSPASTASNYYTAIKPDCGYSGIELLPDQTFVATTYIKYQPGENKKFGGQYTLQPPGNRHDDGRQITTVKIHDMKKRIFSTLFTLCILPALFLRAQEKKLVVTGAVTAQNGEKLAGASLLEKGTTNATKSDTAGNFKIGVSNANGTLIVSYVG